MADDFRSALVASAGRLGISPLDLATVISYETGGTFSPSIRGGAGNRHIGLIQFGPAEQQRYGASQGQTASEQLGAVEGYLTDRGLRPGMGRLDLYSTINAGRPGRYGASDAGNGGAPGTVADKVSGQMGAHEAKAAAFLGGDFTPTMPGETTPPPRQPFGLSGPRASTAPAPTIPDTAAAAPEGGSFDYAGLLKAVGGMGGATAPEAPRSPAPGSLAPPIGGQPAPFDLDGFLARLRR